MTTRNGERFQRLCIACTFCFLAGSSFGQQYRAELRADARAKSIMSFVLVLPGSVHVESVALDISRDGEQFEESRAGFPRPERLVYSTETQLRSTRVLAPIVGRFSGGRREFMFPSPGTYYLRWTVSLVGGGPAPIEVGQVIEVGEPLEQDVAFLARIAEPETLNGLFPSDDLDWLLEKNEDERALHVIRRLLDATRLVEPLEGGGWGRYRSMESFLVSMNTLFSLAKEFSESRYAPFVAFYAGGGYITYLCESDEIPGRLPKDIRSHPLYEKIEEALLLAVEQGDQYLRPRAVFQQARLHVVMGSFVEAEMKLVEAKAADLKGGTITDLVNKARKDIERLQRRQLDR